MSVRPFTERDLELLKLVFQCVENPKALKIDMEKYQALAGFANLHSARCSWCSLKVKLGVNTGKPAAANTEDSTNNPAPAEAETPKTRKRKPAASPSDDSPVSAKKRTKKLAKPAHAKEPEEAQIKQEASPKAPSEGSGSPQ